LDTLKTTDSIASSDTIINSTETTKDSINFLPDNATYPVEIINSNLETTIDTLVNKEFLSHNLELSYRFKLPLLKRKGNHPNLVFYNDSLEISITADKFEKQNRKITFDGGFITQIDGKRPWGIDGNEPSFEIKSIQLSKYKQLQAFPDSLYKDLFDPTLDACEETNDEPCYTNAYVTKTGEIILHMMNSDGAGSYTIFWFIKPNGKIERIVGLSF
jgi:hypothetical protein